MNYNLLNISGYGSSGIATGNIIYGVLQQKETQYDAVFDSDKKQVVVLKSSNLSIDALHKMLYSSEHSPKYDGWYPKVSHKRNGDGNVVIEFKTAIPSVDSDTPLDSSSSFDPSRVTEFGTFGQESAVKMYKALREYDLDIAYDSDSRRFTVLESSNLRKKMIQEIFDECSFEGWEPVVTGHIDEYGNHLVRLAAISELTDSLNTLFDFLEDQELCAQ